MAWGADIEPAGSALSGVVGVLEGASAGTSEEGAIAAEGTISEEGTIVAEGGVAGIVGVESTNMLSESLVEAATTESVGGVGEGIIWTGEIGRAVGGVGGGDGETWSTRAVREVVCVVECVVELVCSIV